MFNLLSTERTLSPPLKTDEYPVDNFKDINIAEGETSQTEQYKFLFEKKTSLCLILKKPDNLI